MCAIMSKIESNLLPSRREKNEPLNQTYEEGQTESNRKNNDWQINNTYIEVINYGENRSQNVLT